MVLVNTTGKLLFSGDVAPEVFSAAAAFDQGEPVSEPNRRALYQALSERGKVFPEVAFAEIGKRKNEFVVESLFKLANAIERIVSAFMAETV